MARGKLLPAHITANNERDRPNFCIGARADGVVCNKRIPIDALYCPLHMNSPESYRDKVLYYSYLARPVRTEMVRRAFHSDNEAIAFTALKYLSDNVEKYAVHEEIIVDDLTALTRTQLLARAKELVTRLEQAKDLDGALQPEASNDEAAIAALQQPSPFGGGSEAGAPGANGAVAGHVGGLSDGPPASENAAPAARPCAAPGAPANGSDAAQTASDTAELSCGG